MEILQSGVRLLCHSWTIPIRLNGRITGIYALQAFALSTLALVKKSYSDHAIRAPRIDHAIHLLKDAQQVLVNIPMTFTCLADLLKALRELSQEDFTCELLFKNASLISALCAHTIGLLQFIDQHGGRAIAQCIKWDKTYLNGMAARVGQSRLFTVCHMSTLSGFQDGMSILSNVMTIAQTALEYKRIAQEDPFKEDHKRLCLLNVACATCRIASLFLVGTTWPMLCFGVVSAVLHISKELYQVELKKKQDEAVVLL